MHQFYKKDLAFQQAEAELTQLISQVELKKVLIEKMVDDPEFNRFKNADEAYDVLDDKFLDRAREACEGSYNIGQDVYTQECFLNGVPYIYTMSIEYNRHDKEFYYLDGWDSSFEPKSPPITEKDVQALINLPDTTLDPRFKQILEEYRGLKGW